LTPISDKYPAPPIISGVFQLNILSEHPRPLKRSRRVALYRASIFPAMRLYAAFEMMCRFTSS